MKKLRIFSSAVSAGLLLAACSNLPPAPPPASKNVTASTAPAVAAQAITADQVSIDPQGMWKSWQATEVPATPYSSSQPPVPTGLPAHIVITFDGKDASALMPSDPALYLIPVEAYETLWNAAGDSSVSRMMQSIYSNTVELQSPPPLSGMPALPFEHVGGGRNDLAVQQGYVTAMAESASKSGFRFVGRWMQSPNPVTNQGLRYVYQGFTNDGRYLVAFFSPIGTSALPATSGDVPADQMSQFNSDPAAYMAAQAEALNKLAPADWQPIIDKLDAVVASLRIAGR